MIIDAIMKFFFNEFIDLLQGAPTLVIPGDIDNALIFFYTAFSQIFLFSHWINFSALVQGILLILSAYTVAFFANTIKKLPFMSFLGRR
jgi:hypothetical protein